MTDQFSGWTELLKLAQAHKTKSALREAITTAGIPILETEPLSGYYRCAAVKGGPLLPVAIWREAGKLIILRSGEPVALERVWPYCVWTPISYDWYEGATERGEKWPDEAAMVGESVPAADRIVAITDNQPPTESEIDALRRQIEAAKANGEEQYQEVTTDEEAAQAQSLRSRLLELSGTADKKREAEKRPHLELCKEIDAKWQPLVKLAKNAADAIRNALSAFETKKFQKQEADRRAAQKVADDARAKAIKDGKPAPEPVIEQAAPPVTTAIKGGSGRAATVKLTNVAKVTDYDKAYQHMKAVPEIKAAIEKVAQRLIDAGNIVPGVEIEQQRKVA